MSGALDANISVTSYFCLDYHQLDVPDALDALDTLDTLDSLILNVTETEIEHDGSQANDIMPAGAS